MRTFKPRIEEFKIYRIFPGGDVEFLHPKDGVFPEKVNEGREKVGHNPRRIGENPNPAGFLNLQPRILLINFFKVDITEECNYNLG